MTMDQLILQTRWKSTTNKDALTLTGLLIEGATFNGNNLAPCTATSENINVVPNCSITWIDRVRKLRFFTTKDDVFVIFRSK